MKVLFPCPSCHRLLQPPIQASGSARLRCPLCQHEILAYDLVQGAHRPWMVIEDAGGEDLFKDFQENELHTHRADPSRSSVHHAGHSPMPWEESKRHHEDETEYRLSESDDLGDGSDESKNPSESTEERKSIQWDKFKPITHDEFQRRRRAEKSPIASMLQVVLGGLAAIPISLLILWYGLGKDVGDAGPWVSQYAPWIVPKKFHRNVDHRDWQPSNSELGTGDFPNLSKFETENSNNNSSSVPSKEDGSNANQGTGNRQAGNEGVTDKEERAELDLTASKSIPESPERPIPKLSDLLRRWKESSDAWLANQGGSADLRKSLARTYFSNTVEVARSLRNINRRAAADRVWLDRCNQMLMEYARDASLINIIEQGSAVFNEPGIGNGIAMVIDVESTVVDRDQVLIKTKPIKLKEVEVELIKPIFSPDSETKIVARYQPGKMVILATVEEKKGVLCLVVHDEAKLNLTQPNP